MSRNKLKLELTWVGKDERPRLEPRILIEDPELSYHAKERRSGDDIFDNILIHGDNLLALKALEAEYAGKVKCVYIDPPFNTQQAMENYEDGVEHSIWLSLLKHRLQCLHGLLSDDGTLFVHIDDNELGYLIVIADEIFGRKNRKFIATFKQGAATGHKSINPGVVPTTNFVLAYARNSSRWNPNRLYTARERDTRYTKFIRNIDAGFSNWGFRNLIDAFAESKKQTLKAARKLAKDNPQELDKFVLDNAKRVTRLARPDYKSVGQNIRDAIDQSKSSPGQIIKVERQNFSDVYIVNGERILFYSDKLKEIDGEYVSGEPLTTLWDDLLSNNLHKEGGVSFPKGKKPEHLIKRCIDLATIRGDLVLDSFLGSGTVAAVAQKMGRRWIGVELGEQAKSHCLPRLRRVVDGDDQDGISKAVNWKGGGGFRFYRLAPSLLEKDKYGNWTISKEYNAAMLAEAVCKNMGFVYDPSQDENEYWRHGHSTEADFIFVTTASMTHAALKKLSEDVGPDRSLLVCCSAFNANVDAFDNLTIKKIPHAVLSKCEWGHDDYSLNVANLPMAKSDEKAEQEDMAGSLPLFENEED